ncbi:MAG: hypothetical protein ACRC0G_06010 [Fusobacteriaceae bacterium]
MELLKNKKILLFAPKFFNYENEIVKKLEEFGAKVDYYDERMSPNNLTKALIRFNKKMIINKINQYYSDIIKKTENIDYDFVFFINPETVTKELLIKFKSKQKKAEFIIYLWDSIKNKNNAKEILDIFDKHFSFDKEDCKNDDRFKFRPLFYLDEYSSRADNKIFNYDLTFIGTAHSDRYRILKSLKNEGLEKKLKNYFFMYFPSKALFYLKKLIDKSYLKTDINDFSFNSISKNEILDIISKSKVIIDIQHPKQTGLTMRSIEMLGMKKKLLTTNKDIVNYDFYNENNIRIIDRDNPELDSEFIKSEYKEINNSIYEKYSIGKWLEEIFGE